jgi:hypothetical protein
MKTLRKWYARNFQIITLAQAKEWKLSFTMNIYGDEINALSNTKTCRSLWKDKNGHYRVDSLYGYKSETFISGYDVYRNNSGKMGV